MCDKLSAMAQRPPHSLPAPSAGPAWPAVLFSPCFSVTGKTRTFVRGLARVTGQKSLSLRPPALVRWEVPCGKCQRSQRTCWAIARLNLGPMLSPTMIQLKLVRALSDLVMTEGAFKRFGRLGPNHCGLAFPSRGASW